jgi:actin-related protein
VSNDVIVIVILIYFVFERPLVLTIIYILISFFSYNSYCFFLQKDSRNKCIPEIVLECLSKTPVDVRRDVASSIILSGGSTCFDGFSQRLNIELTTKLSSVVRVKQVLPSKLERKFSGFCGGSILASLGSFQQLWVSKKQYNEQGANVVANLL